MNSVLLVVVDMFGLWTNNVKHDITYEFVNSFHGKEKHFHQLPPLAREGTKKTCAGQSGYKCCRRREGRV